MVFLCHFRWIEMHQSAQMEVNTVCWMEVQYDFSEPDIGIFLALHKRTIEAELTLATIRGQYACTQVHCETSLSSLFLLTSGWSTVKPSGQTSNLCKPPCIGIWRAQHPEDLHALAHHSFCWMPLCGSWQGKKENVATQPLRMVGNGWEMACLEANDWISRITWAWTLTTLRGKRGKSQQWPV